MTYIYCCDKIIKSKEVDKMAKKPYTTSIDADISGEFKAACEERGIKMNIVLEAFMKQFIDNEFAVKISKNGIRLEIEEK